MLSNNLENKVYYSSLFQIYKKLFTKKQQTYFIAYYDLDLSLNEIATNFNISKNAVYDNLKRVTKNLDHYEEKLAIYQKKTLISEELSKYNKDLSKTKIQEIIKKIGDINAI